MSDVTDRLAAAMTEMVRAAYLAGFSASGEGYNAEWPFMDHGRDPEADPEWIKSRDEALNRLAVELQKAEAEQ